MKLFTPLCQPLLYACLITLTACGGGGGSSNNTNDPDTNTPPDTGTPPDPMPNPSAYLCDSHSATQNTVIGNNTYEFIADDGQCFGTVEDFDLVKQEVPLQLDLSEDHSDLLSISPMGRLATKEALGFTGDRTIFYLAFDLTNIGPSTLCLDFRTSNGAEFRDETNSVIEDFGIEMLGDMFFEEGDYRNDCIPSGETRMVWGSASRELGEAGLSALDHIFIRPNLIEIDFTGNLAIPRLLEALSPTQADWTSSVQTIFGNDQYSYEIIHSFTNETTEQAEFRSDLVNILYFDENNYLLYDSLSRVSDFLGIDDDDLGDDDLLLPASGGMISIRDEFTPIVPAFGANDNILGRAAKMIVHLDICAPDRCRISNR